MEESSKVWKHNDNTGTRINMSTLALNKRRLWVRKAQWFEQSALHWKEEREYYTWHALFCERDFSAWQLQEQANRFNDPKGPLKHYIPMRILTANPLAYLSTWMKQFSKWPLRSWRKAELNEERCTGEGSRAISNTAMWAQGRRLLSKKQSLARPLPRACFIF